MGAVVVAHTCPWGTQWDVSTSLQSEKEVLTAACLWKKQAETHLQKRVSWPQGDLHPELGAQFCLQSSTFTFFCAPKVLKTSRRFRGEETDVAEEMQRRFGVTGITSPCGCSVGGGMLVPLVSPSYPGIWCRWRLEVC